MVTQCTEAVIRMKLSDGDDCRCICVVVWCCMWGFPDTLSSIVLQPSEGGKIIVPHNGCCGVLSGPPFGIRPLMSPVLGSCCLEAPSRVPWRNCPWSRQAASPPRVSLCPNTSPRGHAKSQPLPQDGTTLQGKPSSRAQHGICCRAVVSWKLYSPPHPPPPARVPAPLLPYRCRSHEPQPCAWDFLHANLHH